MFGRNMEDIDVAQLAKARGILLKNHVSEASMAADAGITDADIDTMMRKNPA